MKKPLFIAFEGIDGSGKSTQVDFLELRLKKLGHQVHKTSEPTEGPIGKLIRSAFRGENLLHDKTIAGLFVADRLEHILNKDHGMLHWLSHGHIVICDRYYFSSYAYQAQFTSLEWVIQANSLSASLLKPDLTVFVDVSPAVSMERIKNNRTVTELYENLESLERVKSNYFKVFELLKDQENIFITNGSLPFDEVEENIWQKIKGML
ncbi:MAG: dTMP kinase [Cyclobacteriaceae bacterium]